LIVTLFWVLFAVFELRLGRTLAMVWTSGLELKLAWVLIV
jgi:hypothetical protein